GARACSERICTASPVRHADTQPSSPSPGQLFWYRIQACPHKAILLQIQHRSYSYSTAACQPTRDETAFVYNANLPYDRNIMSEIQRNIPPIIVAPDFRDA